MRIGLGVSLGLGVQGAPAFVPTQVAGCVLWLRADLGITKDGSDYVSEWRDQSASGLIFTAAGGARPLWKSAEIGGRDSIRGDGATDVMDSTTTLDLSAATGLTWFGVMKDTLGGIAGRVAFETSANSGSNDGMGVFPQNAAPPDNIGVYFHGGGVLNYAGMDGAGADLAAAAVVCLIGDSTLTGAAEIKGYINGALSSQQYPLAANIGSGFGNAAVHLLARAGGSLFWPGDFAEVILYSRALAAGERQAIERYLGARYGIAVA